MTIRHRVNKITVFLFFLLLTCFGTLLIDTQILMADGPSMKENWRRLNDKKIFFGHQSVGQNVMAGLEEVTAGQISISVLQNNDFSGNAFYHARIGVNTDPKSKIDAFYNTLAKAYVKPDIAFLKLCFVDVNKDSDVEKIFNYYKDMVNKIHVDFPGIKIVHFTVPLKVDNTSWKTSLKKMLGSDIWEYSDNIARNQYNRLILDEYAKGAMVFDIAGIEATNSGGLKQTFEYKGNSYFSMVSEYSSDGGHLNEKGRVLVAYKLLDFLSQL